MKFVKNPMEPERKLKFGTDARRREHVRKHLLEGRKEKWHQVLDQEMLSAARDEHHLGEWGDACEKLADLYEGGIAETIDTSCRGGHSHLHVARCGLDEKLEPNEVHSLIIECWDAEQRLFVTAAAKIVDDGMTPYRITTGYRMHPQASVQAFRRRLLERRREKHKVQQYVVVARHTDGVAHENHQS